MRHARLFGRLAVTIALAFAHAAPAQPEGDGAPIPDREQRLREVRGTLNRLVTALDAGDGDALRALVLIDRFFSGAQTSGLDALIQCVKAQRELEDAAKEKFGADGAATFASETRLTELDRKALATAPVDFRSEHEAVVGLGPSVAPLYVRRSRRDGQWRVMLRPVSNLKDDGSRAPEAVSRVRIDRMLEVADVLRRVKRDVSEGRYATAADARKALTAALAVSKVKPRGG